MSNNSQIYGSNGSSDGRWLIALIIIFLMVLIFLSTSFLISCKNERAQRLQELQPVEYQA